MITNAWIWAGLSVTFFVLFLYPYTIYPLILRLLPCKPVQPVSVIDDSDLSATIVFCAHNEERVLPEKIANIRNLKSRFPNLEVLAYSDYSDDRTNELLLRSSDVLTSVFGEHRAGKVHGLKILLSRARGDVIVFTDANVLVDPDGFLKLLRRFRDPTIGCVAGTLIYVEEDPESVSPTAMVGGLYWRLEEHIKRLESRTGSTMGADGALFARRRAGYPDFPGHLADDLTASISVIFDGLRCVSDQGVLAYERSVTASHEEFRRKRRIACQAQDTYAYLYSHIRSMSALDKFKFYSHKVIRWWGGALLLATTVCAAVAGFLAGVPTLTLILLGGGALLTWALGSLNVRIVLNLREILLAIIATNIGIIESKLGRHYQLWSPAKSR